MHIHVPFWGGFYSSGKHAEFNRLLKVKYVPSVNAKIQCCYFKCISQKFHFAFLIKSA